MAAFHRQKKMLIYGNKLRFFSASRLALPISGQTLAGVSPEMAMAAFHRQKKMLIYGNKLRFFSASRLALPISGQTLANSIDKECQKVFIFLSAAYQFPI